MKVLLLEDDITLNKSIAQVLKFNGFELDQFYDGLSAYESLTRIYDLYILDIDVPNVSGIEMLKEILDRDKVSNVIMISADNSIEVIERAYNLGCSDFIKKPFHLKELELKIEKLFNGMNSQTCQITDGIYLSIGGQSLIKNGVEITLTKKEFQMLYLLMRFSPNIVTYQQIENYIYDNQSIHNQTIRALIKRVRDKICKNCIKAVNNIGYKLSMNMDD